jgi:hypothetical protein
MHTITIDASPKQLNKLRKGHPVRVKKGSGFNLIVHPETYKRVARTYDKDKGFQLSLSPQELEANQGIPVTPEMHEMKREAMPTPPSMGGRGIFSKSGLKAPKARTISEEISKAVKDTKAGNLLNQNLNYLGRAGIANAIDYASKSDIIKDQINSRIKLPARNMSSGPKEGPMEYVEYLRNPEDTMYKLSDMIMGQGLHNQETGSIGLKGGMINQYLPQAMQSQPYGANFHMQFMLPPQYRKYNDGTHEEGIIGTGMRHHPNHTMAHLPPALQSQPTGANFMFKNFLPVQYQDIHNANPTLQMHGQGMPHGSCGLYASGRAPVGHGLYI